MGKYWLETGWLGEYLCWQKLNQWQELLVSPFEGCATFTSVECMIYVLHISVVTNSH